MGFVSDLKGHLQVSIAAGAAYGAAEVLVNKSSIGEAAVPAGLMTVSELLGSAITTWIVPKIFEEDAKSMAQYRFYLNPLVSSGLAVLAGDSLGVGGSKPMMTRFLMGVGASAAANYITQPSRAAAA